MNSKISLCLLLLTILMASAVSVQASEPTWLFTVPKAETLREGNYNIGFVYLDFGVNRNLELGIHGLKYSLPGSPDIAVGGSFYPMPSPYIVFSPKLDSGGIHLGLKAAPYVFFAGIEAGLSRKIKFIGELNNGINLGLRILLSDNWTLDVFAALTSVKIYSKGYKYEYRWVEFEHYRPVPLFAFAYSGKL